MRKIQVFAGSSHPELASLIVERLGVCAGAVTFRTFANHETSVNLEVSVRNEDVFILQSGSGQVNDHLMELLILINACKSSSAKRITAILPYFPYGKMGKKKQPRGSITAKLVANMLDVAGVDHVITMDLHSSQIQGFFTRPVDNLFAEPAIAKFIRDKLLALGEKLTDAAVVSKNAGGAKRVTSLADRLRMDFAMIHKDSSHPKFLAKKASHSQLSPAKALSAESMDATTIELAISGLTLIGDVSGKIAFIVDDIIDSPVSFLEAAVHLMTKCRAKAVYLVATHGILSGDALELIERNHSVQGVVVTNSYPLDSRARSASTKLEVIDISGILAEAIRRTHNGESISYLFDTVVA